MVGKQLPENLPLGDDPVPFRKFISQGGTNRLLLVGRGTRKV